MVKLGFENRWTRWTRRVALAAGLWAMTAAILAAQVITVAPLARDRQILVSFEMENGFTEEVSAAIHSGLTTTFTYDIGLRRAAPFWIDQTIASATISASVRYDNLTRRYQVTRAHDGRVDATQTTDDEAVVRRWLTEFERLPLFSTTTLEPNTEYYVRVRAQMRPRNAVFPLPFVDRAAASGFAKFTFLPQ